MKPVLAALLALSLGSCAKRPPAPEARSLTILAFNDIYRVEGLVESERGGLARLRTLRASLEAQGEDPLLLLAGDLLSPSFMGRVWAGDQMVEGLGLLDGDPAALDEDLWVIFGNHEFDRSKLADAAKLDQQVEGSGFRWVNSNVVFGAGEDGQPLVAAPNLVGEALVEKGGIKVGLIGVTIDSKHPAYVDRFLDPLTVLRERTAALRAQGAEVVVGITHLAMAEDLALLEQLGAEGPDLIVGGHDHVRQCAERGGRPVYKSDADAATASVIRLTLRGDGPPELDHRYAFLGGAPTPSAAVQCRSAPLEQSFAPDQAVQAWVDAKLVEFDRVWCVDRLQREAGCLAEPLTTTKTAFEAEEERIRRYETSGGSWVADRMRAAFAAEGAQIAFVNAGGLRLNQDLPAGATITRRHVEELIGFPTPLRLIRISGATLQKVVERSIYDWTGNGHWLQVSGFAFRHDPTAGTATALTLLGPDGPRPVRPDEQILAVVPDFLVNPSMGQDGYAMLSPADVISGDKAPELKQVLFEALLAAGEAGVAPAREGRVCNTLEGGPCLAAAP